MAGDDATKRQVSTEKDGITIALKGAGSILAQSHGARGKIAKTGKT